MSFPLSRLMSLGTATYAVYALVKPRHLGAALTSDPGRQQHYDLVATTFGCRDLAISGVALLGRSPRTIQTAMLLRVVLDLADCAVLASEAETDSARTRVAAVTSSWACLNVLATVVDRRRRG